VTRSFRIVHFVPHLGSRGRVPIGALIKVATGRQFVRAQHVPGAECLGGQRTQWALAATLDGLERWSTRSDTNPTSVGPHVVLDVELPVPDDVADISQWILLNVLPRSPSTERSVQSDSKPRPSTLGWQFFQAWHVERLVHRQFKPAADFDGLLSSHAQILDPITHWTSQGKRLLLMEPVVVRPASYKNSSQRIGQRLLAYQRAIDAALQSRSAEVTLIAYLLEGSADLREDARKRLLEGANQVNDVNRDDEAHALVSLVRQVGGDSRSRLDDLR